MKIIPGFSSPARCVELLLAAGADVDVQIGADGVFALFVAANRGHAACVELLLGAGATVDVERKTLSGSGQTPLSVAAAQGYGACVELLLRAYAA